MKWGVKRRTHETKETITTLHSYCADYIYLAREFRRSESNKICPSNAAQHQECSPHPVSWALVLIQTCRAQWASNNSALHFFKIHLVKSAVPLIPLPSRCVLSRPFPELLLQCVLNITGRVLPASADPLMILILMQRWHLLHLRPPRVSPITFSETPELLKLAAHHQEQQQ